MFLFVGVVGGTQSHELARNHPVEVSVFNFLKMLVLCDVEFFVVKPAQPHGVAQSPQTIQNLGLSNYTVHL
jgi:hypothetical protein